MANNIERDIVQMVFDSRQFQKGIQSSIDDIEQLKKSFDFAKAQESLSQLNKASHTDFSPMAQSLEAINSKLSIVGIAAATFVSRVTNSIIDSAQRMANAFVLDPIKMGLEEYETQLNAVQTILANTTKDGTSLQDVNQALDELNSYADLTIYNFTQMTDSIGKFTAAGVDLDTSVSAIKGIANVAAVSGANAESASRAMYQLSQAIASGTVRLQDWNSVQNAGLGGQVLQDALLETARVHGVAIDQIIEEEGSFRESLQRGWLSSDIMLETLEKFTGDLTDAQLESMGYTQEQIKAIQEMAVTANDAATKIKTLTQLKDTMAEALQSGWAQTWRIVFGDFEQAKELWGGIAEAFGSVISNSADARNAMLETWASWGGRVALIDTFYNSWNALWNVITAIGQGIREVFEPLEALDLFQATFSVMKFSEALLEITRKGFDPIKRLTAGLAAALDIVKMAVIAVIEPFKALLGPIKESGGGLLSFLLTVADAIVEFRKWAIETNFFTMVVETIIHNLREFGARVREVIDRIKEFEIVQDVTKWLSGLEQSDFVAVWDGILTVLSTVAGVFYVLALGAKELFAQISKLKVVQDISEWFGAISWSGIKDGFKGISEDVKDFFDSIKNSDLLGKFVEYFDTFDGRRISEFFASAKENFSWISDILGTIKSRTDDVEKSTTNVGGAVENVGTKISESISKALDSLIANSQNIDYDEWFDRLFQILNTGILAAVALGIRKLAGGGWLQDALQGIGFGEPQKIGEALSSMFGSVEGTITAFQNNVKADTLQKIAVAIAILAGSIFLMTLIDSNKLLTASGAIAAMIALLFGSAGALKFIKAEDTIKASAAIIGMSVAIAIMAAAMSSISGISPDEIEASLLALAGGIAALVTGVTALSLGGDRSTVKLVGLLFGLAVTLKLLTGVIQSLGETKPETLSRGLQGIAISMGILVAAMSILSRLGGGTIGAAFAVIEVTIALQQLAKVIGIYGTMKIEQLHQGLQIIAMILGGFALFTRLMDPKGILGASIAMVIMSGALFIMAGAVNRFAGMDWEEVIRGLVALGGAMLILVVAGNAMTGAIVGAAAMLVMSVAVTALAVALSLLGQLNWEQLGVALAGLAATFVILGLAGLILTPLVPVFLGLGIAFLLMGAAAALLGVGLLAASAGLVAIASSAALLGGGLKIIGGALIELIPQLGQALAEAFTNFLNVIGENTPVIIEAMQDIVLGMIEGMVGMIPEIVKVVFEMMGQLLDAILEHLPDLIDKGWEILKAFLKGIVDHIQDVVEMGITLVTNIINGIAEAIPELIDAAFNLILEFLNGIEAAITEYLPKIIAAGGRIGAAIIEGLITGLWDGIDAIKQAISDLVQEAIDRFKAQWGIESPSKVTQEMGHQVMFGWAKGLRDKAGAVFKSIADFAAKAQNGMKPIADAFSMAVDESMDYAPVISPVLNLDGIKSGAKDINKALSQTSLMAGAVYSDDQPEATLPEGVNQGYAKGVGIQLVQNNYSPKALDAMEIFRRTETQMAKLAFLRET